jgi:hypothetical protein
MNDKTNPDLFPPLYDWSDMPKFWPQGKKEKNGGNSVQKTASRPVEKGRRRNKNPRKLGDNVSRDLEAH